MGVKEAYILKIENKFKKWTLTIEEMKEAIEKLGLGDSPEWLACFHALQDLGRWAHHELQDMREAKESKDLHAEKLYIEAIVDILDTTLKRTKRKFNIQLPGPLG